MGIAPYVALNFTIYEKVKIFLLDYKTAQIARKALQQSTSEHPAVILLGSPQKSSADTQLPADASPLDGTKLDFLKKEIADSKPHEILGIQHSAVQETPGNRFR
jgi:hypothetical protein